MGALTVIVLTFPVQGSEYQTGAALRLLSFPPRSSDRDAHHLPRKDALSRAAAMRELTSESTALERGKKKRQWLIKFTILFF